jgi:hypothetical protein
MLFFHGENPFHQPPGRGVLVPKVIDHITIAIDGVALGNQVFFNHVEQRGAFDVFGVAPGHQAIGGEIRGTPQLHDALRNLIRMQLFIVRMLYSGLTARLPPDFVRTIVLTPALFCTNSHGLRNGAGTYVTVLLKPLRSILRGESEKAGDTISNLPLAPVMFTW